jgi:hypothetical protein
MCTPCHSHHDLRLDHHAHVTSDTVYRWSSWSSLGRAWLGLGALCSAHSSARCQCVAVQNVHVPQQSASRPAQRTANEIFHLATAHIIVASRLEICIQPSRCCKRSLGSRVRDHRGPESLTHAAYILLPCTHPLCMHSALVCSCLGGDRTGVLNCTTHLCTHRRLGAHAVRPSRIMVST